MEVKCIYNDPSLELNCRREWNVGRTKCSIRLHWTNSKLWIGLRQASSIRLSWTL